MLTRRCWIILLTALALFACGALAEGAPGLGISELAPVDLEIDETPTLATDPDAVSLTLADAPLDSGDIPVANDGGEWSVSINKSNFPSKAFRNYVKASFDQDGDGQLSKAEADAVFEITLRTWEDWEQGTNKVKCPSLKGVEYFENLNSLCCPECGITSLDVSKNPNLDFLFVYGNKLSKLDLGRNKKLTWLDCAHNMLSKLDLSKHTKLNYLHCDHNRLTALNVSGCAALTELVCNYNRLKSLNVKDSRKLVWLNCDGNGLKSLSLSGCKKLERLYCGENSLKTLDLSKCPNLTVVNCSENQLKALDLSKNTKLERMTCSYNKVKSLNISKCVKLEEMGCEHNLLTTLDVSGCPKLWEICCSYNKLTALDLSKNRKMSQLSAEGNRIDTIDLKNCPGLRKCLKLKQVTGRKVVQWGEEEDGDFEEVLSIDRSTKLTSGKKVLYPGK